MIVRDTSSTNTIFAKRAAFILIAAIAFVVGCENEASKPGKEFRVVLAEQKTEAGEDYIMVVITESQLEQYGLTKQECAEGIREFNDRLASDMFGRAAELMVESLGQAVGNKFVEDPLIEEELPPSVVKMELPPKVAAAAALMHKGGIVEFWRRQGAFYDIEHWIFKDGRWKKR